MNLIQNSSNRECTLTFTGAADQRDACRLHQALAEALRNYTHVVVNVQQVEPLDFTFLQLVCAAHRTAESQNKQFTLTLEEPHAMKDLLVRCGFQCHYGNEAGNLERCVWHSAVFRCAGAGQCLEATGACNLWPCSHVVDVV